MTLWDIQNEVTLLPNSPFTWLWWCWLVLCLLCSYVFLTSINAWYMHLFFHLPLMIVLHSPPSSQLSIAGISSVLGELWHAGVATLRQWEMEHLLDPPWEGTSTEGPASPPPHIAGNRLILDVYLDGCERFLQVTGNHTGDLAEVEFLRLSSNDAMITSVIGGLPRFSRLRSLVLKGKIFL